MTIGAILLILLGIYFPLYCGMIGYDLFIKKDPADLIPKQEDEDVAISDEAGKFQPILIERDTKPKGKKQEETSPVVQPEKETDRTVKGNAAKEYNQTDSDSENIIINEDDEPANRKSLKNKDSSSNQEQTVQLTPAEKRVLDVMERLKNMRLREYGLSQNNDKGQETDNKAEVHKTPTVETENASDTKDSVEKKEAKTTYRTKVASEKSPTEQGTTGNNSIAERTVSDSVPKRKRYESAKKEMPLPDDLPKASTFNPVVRIDEEAKQTKHENGKTVEQLETEIKETFEDKIAMARKIAESGWLLYSDSIPDVAEDDILEPPKDEDDPPPKASSFNPRQ